MALPDQKFTNKLNPIKGWGAGHPHAIDKVVNLADGHTPGTIKAGMVVHMDTTTGKATLGGGTPTRSSMPVPMFVFQNDTDFDVVSDGGIDNLWNSSQGSVGVKDGGHLMGLPVTGAYELQTTAFAADTYAPGDALIGHTDGKVQKAAGNVAETVCAIVSDGKLSGTHDVEVVQFWTVFQPFMS